MRGGWKLKENVPLTTVTTAELVHSVQERPGWALPNFAETLEQIELALKSRQITEAQALAWIGELYDFAARLGLEPGLEGGVTVSPRMA